MQTKKILLLDNTNAKSFLEEKSYQFVTDNCYNPSVLFVRSKDLHNYEIPDSVISITRLGSGYDNIPVDECTKKGIAVFTTPHQNSNSVKELVLYYLLAYERTNFNLDKVKDIKFIGHELKDKTICIIGLGNIGIEVAHICSELGMNVIGYDPYNNKVKNFSYYSNFVKYNTIEECIKYADFITIHIPLNETTKNLISDEFINNLEKTPVIINTSRKDIVNEQAIQKALDDNKIKAYITDFPSNIIKSDNYFYTSHIGASTYESEQRCMDRACLDLTRYIEEGSIPYTCINLPCLEKPQYKKHRATIICKPEFELKGDFEEGIKNNIKYCIIDSNEPIEMINDPNIIKMRILY